MGSNGHAWGFGRFDLRIVPWIEVHHYPHVMGLFFGPSRVLQQIVR